MEAGQAYPASFTKCIWSYWRRQKYQKVDAGETGSRGTRNPARLGDCNVGSRPWEVRIGGMFRVRVKAPAPAAAAPTAQPGRVLGWMPEAYVGAMVGPAKKQQPSAALARTSRPAPEAMWQKRIPIRRSRGQAQAQQKADELGQKLVLEMYKSVRASRDLSGMLHASTSR